MQLQESDLALNVFGSTALTRLHSLAGLYTSGWFPSLGDRACAFSLARVHVCVRACCREVLFSGPWAPLKGCPCKSKSRFDPLDGHINRWVVR